MKDMPVYMAAYDTENETCFDALPRIVEVHEQFQMPATFFIATHLLAGSGAARLKALLDRPLFEIASHSHRHDLLAAHSRSKTPPIEPAQLPEEVLESKHRLEQLFGRRVTGFRPPWGYGDGLRGAPRLLDLLTEGGYQYVSSVLWGPNDTLPAPIRPPFTYAAQGHPRLWEIPSCGWHENVTKKGAVMMADVIAPSFEIPAALITRALASADEEFELDRLFLDRAAADGAPHMTLIWHPWSLGGFDPRMRMLELLFAYVRAKKFKEMTFEQYAATL